MPTSTKPWLAWLVYGKLVPCTLFSADALSGTKGTRESKVLSCSLLNADLLRCNKHLLGLGQDIKASLTDADLIGYQFGAVG
ncbi:unnamed protein product, partial [Mycena citricolor]